ncbi:hypothetical protein BJ138DRAFT_1106376 [Hygrophoropsis aurantiaca]|uniref:Uncharacterized protein n=1 Tax=Hygrophoropsis aurantiaca TaxID=72124 RepID=A0ACB7ZV78_9AGAM|nr:hypothetical protein BJ138DRAFT_1106376 [Hygrophoropsis aurantiaca]
MADPTLTIEMLQIIQRTNYLAAGAGALIAYDQVLTFAHEARYSGSLSIMDYTCQLDIFNVIMYLVVLWATNIFLLSMQAILVIRVYALLNRSKKVLVFLATCYTLQAAAVFVMTALEYNSGALHGYVVSIGPTIGSVTQNIVNSNTSTLTLVGQDSTIVSLVFDGILLSFALRAFVIHALEAKTLNRGWSVNVLVRTIVTDHLVYFVCNIIWLSLVIASKYLAEQNVFTTLAVLAGPRMVTSLRATDTKTRREGRALESELSTIRFGIQEPLTLSQSMMEEGGGFRATDEDYESHLDSQRNAQFQSSRQGNHYEIYEQAKTPEICMYLHLRTYVRYLEKVVLRRLMEPEEFIFPRVGSNGIYYFKQEMSYDAVQKMLTKLSKEAGLSERHSSHCLRRGGAKYRFLEAPLGERWSLSIIRWFGGWAEGESVDTLIRYLLDDLTRCEKSHRDALCPIPRHTELSFNGDHVLVNPITGAESRELKLSMDRKMDNMAGKMDDIVEKVGAQFTHALSQLSMSSTISGGLLSAAPPPPLTPSLTLSQLPSPSSDASDASSPSSLSLFSPLMPSIQYTPASSTGNLPIMPLSGRLPTTSEKLQNI